MLPSAVYTCLCTSLGAELMIPIERRGCRFRLINSAVRVYSRRWTIFQPPAVLNTETISPHLYENEADRTAHLKPA